MNTAPKPARPVAVNIGLTLLLVATFSSVSRSALRADWGNRLVWVKFGVELMMLVIPLWFIYQKKNWARWLLLAYALGGVCVALPYLQHPHMTSWWLRWGVVNLIAVGGLAALFLPSATKWFRANDDAKAA